MTRSSRAVYLLTAVLTACSSGSGTTTPSTPTVGSVALAPAAASISVNATTTLTATVKTAAGTVLTDQTLTWTTSNSAVATVSNGVVTGVSAGTATITAGSTNGKQGSATVTVLGPPASLTVTRSGSYILVGDTLQLSVVLKDAAAQVVSGGSPSWSVTAPAVGSMSGATLTAATPGVVQVTATVGQITGSAQITVSPGGGTRVPSLSLIDSTVLAEMRRLGIPGGSMSITKDGRLVFSRAYGYADSVTKRPSATDQLWRIGSTSKPITAIAIMKLVEAGLISLDDKPFVLLTGIDLIAGQTQDPRLLNITVRDLLQHSGGWNVSRNIDDVVFAALQASGNIDPKALVKSGRGVALAVNPGTQYAYTNYEYLVLGRMIERATGLTYDTYVKNTILAPAGITDMKLGRTPVGLRDPKEVSYYDNRGTVTALYGTGIWPDVGGAMEYSEAAGQWIGSSLDLVKFLGEIDGNPTRTDIVSSSTMATMTAQNFTLWPISGYHYGLGLEVNTTTSGTSISHTGGADGGDAYMVRRGDGVSAAVLFNLTRSLTGNTADAAINQALDRITSWPTGVVF